MHVDCPAGQTVPALHEPRTQGCPAWVGVWQTPHVASGARAQNVVAHCASSPHGPPAGTMPGSVLQPGPSSPLRKAGQASAAIDCSHAIVLAGVALVPVAPKLGRQLSITRALHVGASP